MSDTQSAKPWAGIVLRLFLFLTVVHMVMSLLPLGFGSKSDAVMRAPAKPPLEITPVGEDYNQRLSLWQRGQDVYYMYCVGCHGPNGDGKGPAAERLETKPRDFTSGIYKFRSTDSGSLPLDEDLHRTITRGLARVSMPAFPQMSEPDKLAVIEYIKALYPKWEQEKSVRKKVFVPQAPADVFSSERAGRGRVVYLSMGCGNCHGSDGAGKGATQTAYTDAWGNPQGAFNFTRGRLKSGDDPEDVYRVFHTGLRSIMPAFGGDTLAYVSAEQAMAQSRFMEPGEAERLKPSLDQFPAATSDIGSMTEKQREDQAVRNSWDLVSYIFSLRASATPIESTAPKLPGPHDPPAPSSN